MRTQVICEIGSNYESLQDIRDSIEFANRLGCIPKLQAFTHDEMNTPNAELPRSWMVELAKTNVFYSVFGLDSLAFLETEVKPKIYKIASSKATDKQLIKAVASTHKQTIISVGGCTLDEIRQCAKWFEEGSDDLLWWTRITLMHSIVVYKKCDAQLGFLRDRIIGSRIIPWGYSQNYSSEENLHLPSVAVAFGSVSCEVHFRLDHIKNTPDTNHSLTPLQFTKMVNLIKSVEENMGNTERPTADEIENLKLARKPNDGL